MCALCTYVCVRRLEREWEEKLLKEREQMLSELEGAQQTAQDEIDRQQQEFQDKIQTLSMEMVSMHWLLAATHALWPCAVFRKRRAST